MQSGVSVSLVARQAGLSLSLLFKWRRRMLEGGFEAVQADEEVVGQTQVRDLKKRVRELERLLGRKTLEVETRKEALEVARAKNRSRCCRRGAIAGTVRDDDHRRHAGCRRSSSVERLARTSKPCGRYHKDGYSRLRSLLRRLVDERPSYGYRRITALLNRRPQGQDLPKVNTRRVLRILQNHDLTLQRHTAAKLAGPITAWWH